MNTPALSSVSPTHWHRSLYFITIHSIATLTAAFEAVAQSLNFVQNANSQHDYARHTTIPSGFGSGEFTLEVWLRPDDSFPIGATGGGSNQLIRWSSADPEPYSSSGWWFTGNFLLDGHNNSSFADGTFSLQFVGGGRVRWDFGDGAFAGNGGHWAVQAWPSNTTPSLLDGNWHYVACVRRWTGASSANLELWIDGTLIATETSNLRTNMRTAYWNNWTGFPNGQEGWFWGAEKQAAILTNGVTQYEDYKGLVDELRFWNRAKTAQELSQDWEDSIVGTENGLVGWYTFSEGSGTQTCNDLGGGNCMTLFRTTPETWSSENAPVDGSTPGDPDYVYANFNAAPGGNGAQATPFNSMAAAVAFANANATVEVAPGATDETLTITKALTVINGNPEGGSVSIGNAGARSAPLNRAATGFVSTTRR